MNIKHVFLFFAVGALVVACKTPPIGHDGVSHKPVKTYEIEFVVKGDQKLNIVTPDKGCNKNENGCMRVPSANSGEITFKFQMAQQLPCSDHPNSWILSKIELANIEGGFGKPVNTWIVENFGANALTGVVWEKTPGQEVTSHTIKDTNTKSGEVYYLITAESCDPDKDPINTDPRVINEGAPSLL
jgi:hypothetical protein